MKIGKEPHEIMEEMEKGIRQNQRLTENGLYEDVEQYENFYAGRQWEGVNAPNLEKPVLNFTYRVVSYCISMLVSDDIGVEIRPFRRTEGAARSTALLGREVERAIERSRLKTKLRQSLKDAAVDGDCCMYLWTDLDQQTGQTARGEIACEGIENTKVLFGDPYTPEVQAQPYLLILRRRQLDRARELARENGAGEEAERIQPDSESLYGEDSRSEDLVTCVTKLWKENGTVRWKEVCRSCEIQKERDTGYRIYPLAWMPWAARRGSYHGRGILEGMIPNQIFVNKMWAMMMVQVKNTSFPKIFYDKTLLPNGWNNRVADAIGVNGPPDRVVAQNVRPAEMSAQALDLVEKTISYTKDYMGANDVALGNVRPENTSAIIATQKASSAPLELQRLGYYQFVEDIVRVMCEIMRCDYGVRMAVMEDESGTLQEQLVDFSALDLDQMELNVEVGMSSYWSEITQQQSADNLLKAGVIQDAADYLERLPDKWVKDKAGLLRKLRERQAMAGTGAAPLNAAVGDPGIAAGAMADLSQGQGMVTG